MFCPKCGTKNPEDGKFCRKCGTDLAGISAALSGGSTNYLKPKGRKSDRNPWESAFGSMSTGIAFLLIACILGYTGVAGGQFWWYWMLIPGFSMIGAGAAKIMRIRSSKESGSGSSFPQAQNAVSGAENQALPPSQTDYVSPVRTENYDTGDLVPSSVVENTTKLLELDAEGNVVNTPKKR